MAAQFSCYRRLKIGYYLSDGKFLPHPGCSRAVKEAVALLKKLGHTVVEVSFKVTFMCPSAELI